MKADKEKLIQRTTMDLPKELYVNFKKHVLLNRDISFKNFIVQTMEKEIEIELNKEKKSINHE